MIVKNACVVGAKSDTERSHREKKKPQRVAFREKLSFPLLFVLRECTSLKYILSDLYLLIACLALYKSVRESRSINAVKNNSPLPD